MSGWRTVGRVGQGLDEHAQLITDFYAAFSRRDAEAMVACYHDEVTFADPAFGQLRGRDAGDMWRMLCLLGKDLRVRASSVSAEHGRGQAHWEADYTFVTRRRIHNVVDAEFDFAEGLILRHTDNFDFGRWAGQAFGPPGAVIGRIPVLPAAVMQTVSRAQLRRFQVSQRD